MSINGREAQKKHRGRSKRIHLDIQAELDNCIRFGENGHITKSDQRKKHKEKK